MFSVVVLWVESFLVFIFVNSQSCQPQHPCPGSVVSGVGMVVLCLCHGGHAWVASGVAPGKMQSHFALNTGGWFLDSHVQIFLITPSIL